MTTSERQTDAASATARADLARGEISASVLLRATPERIFRALTSTEICDWWMRPGVFDTRELRGDLRVGGRWEAAGIGVGQPYRLEGEYLKIEEPLQLVHTWKAVGTPGNPATVTYRLEPEDRGTRLTLDHNGLLIEEVCERTRAGWETSLVRLFEILREETATASV